MSDLIYLLDQLVDLKGNIIIPEVNRDVAPLTDDERATYTDIDFDKVSNEFRICGIVYLLKNSLSTIVFVNLSVYHSAQLKQKKFFWKVLVCGSRNVKSVNIYSNNCPRLARENS